MPTNTALNEDDGNLILSIRPSEHPELLIYHPKGPHTHTFVILHGRGDNAPSFGPEFMVAEHSSRNFKISPWHEIHLSYCQETANDI